MEKSSGVRKMPLEKIHPEYLIKTLTKNNNLIKERILYEWYVYGTCWVINVSIFPILL